jgi:hypothetical protein
MTEKPELKIVEETQKGEHNPNTVFENLSELRKAQKLTVQRKTVLVNVAVDKPPNNSYFRVHRDWLLDEATVIKDPDTGTYYFVVPAMRRYPKITPRLRQVTLAAVSIWPAGTVLIWPVPILGGRDFKAWKSARAAYELAREQWVQIAWAESLSDYVIETAEGIEHDPMWPDKTFEELLKLGFDGKVIDNEDHPYVRQLRGLLD